MQFGGVVDNSVEKNGTGEIERQKREEGKPGMKFCNPVCTPTPKPSRAVWCPEEKKRTDPQKPTTSPFVSEAYFDRGVCVSA